jgi:uncharacterized membrane protein
MSLWRMTTGGCPHPVHAILLAFPIALFSSAVVADIAYLNTAHVQWSNFSSWLIAGAQVFGGLVLAWALASLALGWSGDERRPRALYAGVLAVMWLLGLINAFKHSQDGWSSVGAFGLTLSILCALLALGAGVLAFTPSRNPEVAR